MAAVSNSVLLLIVGLSSASLTNGERSAASAPPSFASFIETHGRSYTEGTQEYGVRHAIFHQRLAEVVEHNARSERLWNAGINHLADWTPAELKQLRGWKGGAAAASDSAAASGDGEGTAKASLLQSGAMTTAMPAAVLYKNLSVYRHIEDQGSCGSCWAIAAATVLQAHSELHMKSKRRTFSAQELVSCVPNPDHCGGGGGCGGATVELAMHQVMHVGLGSAEDVPYTATNGVCKSKNKPAVLAQRHLHKNMATIARHVQKSGVELGKVGVRLGDKHGKMGQSFGLHGWERLPENKYAPLMRALVEKGPVAVSVMADTWQLYQDGIFDFCPKDATIDHAVTMMGYGKEKTGGKITKFWDIQNSWGDTWGEKGHIRLLRKDNEDTEYCGLDKHPQMGTACTGETKAVKVCGMCGVLYDNVVPLFGHPSSV